MAATSIWSIRGQIGKAINYAVNPDKTENLDYQDDVETGSLEGVLDYTTSPDKTEEQFFVSGINCTPDNARQKMRLTKKQYDKCGGIVAFDAYQSFKPGETTPATARASDRLCAEYGLSVINDPKHGKSKHYGEWNAEREGKPTWRSLIKSDVDEAIEKAMTDRQFYQNLERIGYAIKTGKDISVRPPGKERYVRLARSFGDNYTYEGIKRRILANKSPRLPLAKPKADNARPKKLPPLLKGNLIGLYRHYKYLFGYYSRGSPTNNRMHFLLREDIRKFDQNTDELKLLEKENISTIGQLHLYRETLNSQIQGLTDERHALRAQKRKVQTHSSEVHTNPRIEEMGLELKDLRKEVRQCKSIETRSTVLQKKVRRIEEPETIATKNTKDVKEVKDRGNVRRSSRTTGQDDAFRQ